MKIGVNTFGLGPYLKKDAAATWQGLLEAGVTSIEPCVAFHRQPPRTEKEKAVWEKGIFDGIFDVERAGDLIQSLRGMGFEVYTFQLQVPAFTMEAVEEALPFMEKNGLRYCVYSFMERSVSKVAASAPALRQAAALLKAHGIELLIHNHDMEWLPDEETCVMRWLLENIPELRFEIDLGWTEYAGVSSVEILKAYPNRFPLLHIKEIAKGVKAWQGQPLCTAPGKGILPLEEILAIAKTMPLNDHALIIDQDDSVDGDIVADIAFGIQKIGHIMAEDKQ